MYTTKPHFRSRSGRIFLSLEYSTLRFRSKSIVFSPRSAALEAICLEFGAEFKKNTASFLVKVRFSKVKICIKRRPKRAPFDMHFCIK